MKKILKIKGMHCASCASIIEKTIKKDTDVKTVSVNFATEKASLEFDDTKTNVSKLSESIKSLGYEFVEEENHMNHDMSKMEETENNSEIKAMKRNVIIGLILAFVSGIIMFWEILASESFAILPEMSEPIETFAHHLMPIMATYVLFVIGLPYLKGVIRFFRTGKANMDTLIGLGTFVAFFYSFLVTALQSTLAPYINVKITYYDVTIVVIALITLGKYLEANSKELMEEKKGEVLGLLEN